MGDTDYRQDRKDSAATGNPSDLSYSTAEKKAQDAAKRERGRDAKTDDPANRDPLSGAPGAHPVGTGVGAAVGGAAVAGGVAAATVAGAGMGAVGGPAGLAVGAVVGAIVGGLAGKGIAEKVNPTEEHAYWEKNYTSRPYAGQNASYTDYGPAYQYGWESRSKHPGREFQDVESDLKRDWDKAKGRSTLEWDRAKEATRDSWNRLTHRQANPSRPADANDADLSNSDRRNSDM